MMWQFTSFEWLPTEPGYYLFRVDPQAYPRLLLMEHVPNHTELMAIWPAVDEGLFAGNFHGWWCGPLPQ